LAKQEQSSIMLAFLLGLFRVVWLFGKDSRGVVLENLALRSKSPFKNTSASAMFTFVSGTVLTATEQ
jgi:hypothetical protein